MVPRIQGSITDCPISEWIKFFQGCEQTQTYKKAAQISQIGMSEGQSRGLARRSSGGGGRAECHATPPPPPLTRSGSDQNTTSRSPNSEGEGASPIQLSGLEGSDGTGVIQYVTLEVEKSPSWQVVTSGEGEKKGLSPGELTGGCVFGRAASSGQPSGQLIGKPVTHIQGGEVNLL